MKNRLSIPQADPGAGYRAHRCEIDAAIQRVLKRGRYILGDEVGVFEREFAAYLGIRHAVGVASGTDALELALRACGIGPGDEVLTVSHTAVATVAAIRRCGAIPIFVDVDPDYYTMDPESAEQQVALRRRSYLRANATARRAGQAKNTKAIVPVHLYGCPSPMPAIMRLAKQYDLSVVEDCAQAHGAELNGRKAGTFGDAGAFSFYPTKNLGAFGDGGAVVTGGRETAERLMRLREYGWKERYVSAEEGVNSRLDEIQAAILRVKLKSLDEDNLARQKIAAIYTNALAGSPVIIPHCPPGGVHVYHQYVVRVRRRDAVRARLQKAGVGTLIHYPMPVHLQPAYRRFAAKGRLPVTEKIAGEILSLPIYPELGVKNAIRVAECLLKALW